MKKTFFWLTVAVAALSFAHLAMAAPKGKDPELEALRAEVKALEAENARLNASLEGVRLIARKQAALARRAKLEAQAAKAREVPSDPEGVK